MKKRILSMLLTIVMLVGLLPTTVLATGGSPANSTGGEIGNEAAMATVLGEGNYTFDQTTSTITLLNDVTFSGDLKFKGLFTLDLNGHTLDMGANSVIIEDSAMTTITNSTGNGKINSSTYAVKVKDYAELYLSGTPDLNGTTADVYFSQYLSYVYHAGYSPANGGPVIIEPYSTGLSKGVVYDWNGDPVDCSSHYRLKGEAYNSNNPYLAVDGSTLKVAYPYDVWVAGVRVTDRNKHDILNNGTVSLAIENVSQDVSGSYIVGAYYYVLTLNNAALASASAYSDGYIVFDYGNNNNNELIMRYAPVLKLVGENTITTGSSQTATIYLKNFSDEELNIIGEGSLSITNNAANGAAFSSNNDPIVRVHNKATLEVSVPNGIVYKGSSNDKDRIFADYTKRLLVEGTSKDTAVKQTSKWVGDNKYIKISELPPSISITTQPAANTTVTAGSISGSLTVTGKVSNSSSTTPAYQWYSNTTNSTSGGTLISGATGSTFTIPTDLEAGSYYYYCVLSATGAASVNSNVAKVIVNAAPSVPTHTHNCGHSECSGAWENFVEIDQILGYTTNPTLRDGSTYYFVLGDNMSSSGFNPTLTSGGTATVYLCLNGQTIKDITIPVGVTMYICDCTNVPGSVSDKFRVDGTAMIGSGGYHWVRFWNNTCAVHVYGTMTLNEGDNNDYSSSQNKSLILDNADARLEFLGDPYQFKVTPYGAGVFATGWKSSYNAKRMPVSTNDAYEVVYDSTTGQLSFVAKVVPYTVTYDANGGTGTVPTQDATAQGGTFTIPDANGLTKDGYTFSGWNDGEKTYAAGDTYTMPAKDVTFTAQWEKTVERYDVWVGGVQVASDNLVIDSADNAAIEGSATYNPETCTLTLNGFSYTGQGYEYDSTWCAAIFSKNDLTVEVVGSNTVTASVTGDYTAEALCVWGALTITGDSGSSLTLTGAGRNGVDSGGDLKIENVTVNATGLGGLCSWEGSITIKNAEVTATATGDLTEAVAAIYAYEGNFTIENSTVTVNAPHTNAVYSFKSELCYTIKNSNVTISAAKYGIGLTVWTSLFVENSTVEVTSDAGLAIVNDQDDSGAVPSFTGTHVVYAGADKASATEADASEDATYANKYVKIVPIQTYDVYVGGVQVTEVNKDNIVVPGATGTATYDPDSRTLTLDNFSCSSNAFGGVIHVNSGNITIKLKGNNTLTSTGEDTYGIYTNGNLVICNGEDGVAQGQLTINTVSACIDAPLGTLEITGVKVTATSEENRGLSADRISLSGVTLSATGGGAPICTGFVPLVDPETGYPVFDPETGEPVRVYGAINIENSTVEAYCTGTNYAFKSAPNISGTFDVYAGEATPGVYVDTPTAETYTTSKYVKIVPIQTYDVWVAGQQFTSKKLTIEGDSGTAAYVPATNTLTLNNFSYTGAGYKYDDYLPAVIYTKNDLIVNLVGSNTLNCTGDGIYAAGYSLTIQGNDKDTDALTVTSKSNNILAGNITIRNATITENDMTATGNLSITGSIVNTDDNEANGSIWAMNGTLCVTSSTINCKNDNSLSGTGVTITESTITTADGKSCYIESSGAIEIDNSNVTVAKDGKPAISADTSLTIRNSTVNATTTGNRNQMAFGIFAIGDIMVKGSQVTASGSVFGIVTMGGMSVSGSSTVTATATSGELAMCTTDGENLLPLVPDLTGAYSVTAGSDAENATKKDASAAATYANKYVKIVPIQTYDVYYNLNLGSDIDFRFLIKQEDLPDHTGLTATITHIRDEANGFANKTITATWATYEADDVTYWQLRYNGVAAKEMTDDLVLKITDAEGNVVLEHTSSVKTYAEDRIANSADAKTVALMKALLGYGGTAQKNFDYKADAPAGAALTYGDLVDGAGNGLTSGTGNVNIYYNLNLGSDIDFRFLIKQDDLPDHTGLTATITHVRDAANGFADKTVNVEWGTYTAGGVTYWMLRYNGIAAKEMTDNLVLTITDAEGNIVVKQTSSVLAYAVDRIANSRSEETVALMKSLLGYGAAAQTNLNYKINNLADSVLTK